MTVYPVEPGTARIWDPVGLRWLEIGGASQGAGWIDGHPQSWNSTTGVVNGTVFDVPSDQRWIILVMAEVYFTQTVDTDQWVFELTRATDGGSTTVLAGVRPRSGSTSAATLVGIELGEPGTEKTLIARLVRVTGSGTVTVQSSGVYNRLWCLYFSIGSTQTAHPSSAPS